MMTANDVQALVQHLDRDPAEIVHLNLSHACADSARNWREIGIEALKTGNTNLAMFAQKCAWDNERIAEEEAKAAQNSPADAAYSPNAKQGETYRTHRNPSALDSLPKPASVPGVGTSL